HLREPADAHVVPLEDDLPLLVVGDGDELTTEEGHALEGTGVPEASGGEPGPERPGREAAWSGVAEASGGEPGPERAGREAAWSGVAEASGGPSGRAAKRPGAGCRVRNRGETSGTRQDRHLLRHRLPVGPSRRPPAVGGTGKVGRPGHDPL